MSFMKIEADKVRDASKDNYITANFDITQDAILFENAFCVKDGQTTIKCVCCDDRRTIKNEFCKFFNF